MLFKEYIIRNNFLSEVSHTIKIQNFDHQKQGLIFLGI